MVIHYYYNFYVFPNDYMIHKLIFMLLLSFIFIVKKQEGSLYSR